MLVNPPVDRKKPIHEVADVFVHVVEERDDGIVVSGAKMLATGFGDHARHLRGRTSSAFLEKGKAEDFALVFIAPMDAAERFLCRSSLAGRAQSVRQPAVEPLNENDAVFLFDNALIPWENVLVYRDTERANSFYRDSGFFSRYNLQSATRLGVKLDSVISPASRQGHRDERHGRFPWGRSHSAT